MPNRKVEHVVPRSGGRWAVKAKNVDKASSIHDNKDEAIRRAKELAKDAPLGQIIIHKKDGTIQTEHTYGKDPEKYPD
jgi:uncharacterized protein YdaT